MLDANELERMARERPEECFLKGSGVLKLIAAVRQLEGEVARLKRGHKSLGECIHNMTVAQQSAWIEWKHGKGADAAMGWIHNGLAGPGFIPDEDEPYGKEAQAWYDANNANPLPACHCGRPSNIAWKDGSACSEAHYREAKGRQEAAAAGVPAVDPLQRGYVLLGASFFLTIAAVLVAAGAGLAWLLPTAWAWLKPIIHGWTA